MRVITWVFLRNLHFFKSSWIVFNISVSKIQHLIETFTIKCPFWIAVFILRIKVIVIFKNLFIDLEATVLVVGMLYMNVVQR